MYITLSQLQEEMTTWQAHNFPGRPPNHPLMGIGEEYGELLHAVLKREQGIRGTASEHHAAAQDALADMIIFMADYCNAMGYNLAEILDRTWAQVRQRDWQANKATGAAITVESV